MSGDHRPVDAGEPDGFGFGNEIADREKQAVLANEHGIASPFGAEDRSRKGILGNLGTQGDDRPERLVQIEAQLLRARLKLSGKTQSLN